MIMMALARRKRLLVGIVAFVVVAIAVAWRVFRVSDLARIGSGYSAEQTCACLFIAGRPLASCLGDLDPLARKLIKVQPGRRRSDGQWVRDRDGDGALRKGLRLLAE